MSKQHHLRAGWDPLWHTLEWVTVQEASDWLRVNIKLVYRLAEEDRTFPAIKVGGIIRIRRSRLERWLERHHPSRKLPAHSGEGAENP